MEGPQREPRERHTRALPSTGEAGSFFRVCNCAPSSPSPVKLSVNPSTWLALSSSSPVPSLLLQGFCSFGQGAPCSEGFHGSLVPVGKSPNFLVTSGASGGHGGGLLPLRPAYQIRSSLCAAPSPPSLPSALFPNPPRPARPTSTPASSSGPPCCPAPGSLPCLDLHPVGDMWPLHSSQRGSS